MTLRGRDVRVAQNTLNDEVGNSSAVKVRSESPAEAVPSVPRQFFLRQRGNDDAPCEVREVQRFP